jgi:hypothetical protein
MLSAINYSLNISTFSKRLKVAVVHYTHIYIYSMVISHLLLC